jgi:hypothetical protein
MISHVLAVTVMAAMLTMPASAKDWWMPSPISMALTVGQWLIKDRQEVYYLQVQAEGRDETDAREQAFKLAVNQAIGTLIISESEARDGHIVRDEIIAHSSGMVHDFKIIQSHRKNHRQIIMIDVWVAKSQIADRILSRSKDHARIEGGRISQQIESYQATRLSGDSVLATVLDDYPSRAFIVQVGHTKVAVDPNRDAKLLIDIGIAWSPAYLTSIKEAAQSVSHQPECSGWFKRTNPFCVDKQKILVGTEGGWFDDNKLWDMYISHLVQDPARLLLTVLDSAGNAQYRDCWIIHKIDPGSYGRAVFLEWSKGIIINPDASYRGDIALDLASLPTRRLDRVEAEMVRKSQCPS